MDAATWQRFREWFAARRDLEAAAAAAAAVAAEARGLADHLSGEHARCALSGMLGAMRCYHLPALSCGWRPDFWLR